MRNKKKHGIGLLELMISLAVIAAIILIATRYFTKASDNLRVTQATQMVHSLVDASFKWLEANNDFSALPSEYSPTENGIDILIKDGYLTKKWENYNNPWGTTGAHNWGIWLGKAIKDSANTIAIYFYNIPRAACHNINDIMARHGMKFSIASGKYCIGRISATS